MGVKKGNKKRKIKFSSIIGLLLCLLLMPILIVNITLIIKSYINKDEVPSIGDIIPMVVLTDSMYPEIESGDLIILNKINGEDVRIDDIITFFDPSGNGTSTVTHRIIEVTSYNGNLAFRTKGDANDSEDKDLVTVDKLIGIYSFKISGLGNIAMFMSTTQGLIICVIVPLILLIGFDLISRKKIEKKNETDKEALMAELEKLRSEKRRDSE